MTKTTFVTEKWGAANNKYLKHVKAALELDNEYRQEGFKVHAEYINAIGILMRYQTENEKHVTGSWRKGFSCYKEEKNRVLMFWGSDN